MMHVVQPRQIRLFKRKLRFPKVIPNLPPDFAIKLIQLGGAFNVQMFQECPQVFGTTVTASDAVIVICKSGPCFQLPFISLCECEQGAL